MQPRLGRADQVREVRHEERHRRDSRIPQAVTGRLVPAAAPGLQHDSRDDERGHKPGSLLDRHGKPHEDRPPPGGQAPGGGESIPAHRGAHEQRHEQAVGHPAGRVADVDVHAGHHRRQGCQVPRQHGVEDHRAERPGGDVDPDGRLGGEPERQQWQVGLEGQCWI